jgi:hypothetical protein
VIIVFNPQSGARAELSRVANGVDEWAGTVAYKGRHLLDAGTTVAASTLAEALNRLAEKAACEATENGARAVRDLIFEL